MKNRWLGMACVLPLLVACNSESSTIPVSSETVSQKQIDTITSNINELYPEATPEQKQKAAEVVVRAIENMVFVEGGSFDMGDFKMDCDFPTKTENRLDWSPDAQCFNFATNLSGAQHLHKVTLDSYSIAKYETSFMDMEWIRQINELPVTANKWKGYAQLKDIVLRDTEEYSELIKWHQKKTKSAQTKAWQESKDYCQWLGEVSGLPFDLPTEVQWEYAARSRGQHYYYATNDGYRSIREGRYFDPNIGKYVDIKPSEVNSGTSSEEYIGQWPANPLGVYGMSNGIQEWVNDWYAKEYYLNSPEHNPQGPENGIQKVVRDGGGIKTFDRFGKDPVLDGYSPTHSFRCSVQQPKPLAE
ncbi:formylglycine-generating enzyme family protein [Vibrio campbellii]|uniref:Formylglycine-generating enzyme family protein n=1 Tax=Vibrio campbellii TaxID=680 RepID=A0ABY5IIY6_9VIBR|nr:SUMF1/EgtB/PvdO family nonheme iron enzyme [Vibrio campbellii]UTZ23595.1 formylglycine-generating enzyme family protein [Vibrio campbellii]UTZ34270.1 formylglycine-generating enzyme family protein [Vibrio campbellii]